MRRRDCILVTCIALAFYNILWIASISNHAVQNMEKVEHHHINEWNNPDISARVNYFKNFCEQFEPVTDKIGEPHWYHKMYGTFLLPLASHKENMKMLEIGLGCNMGYGPGASVAIWTNLFPKAWLWEAEYVEKCVRESESKGLLKNINVLVGDQSNYTTLDKWISFSGGKFDVIIDDGGHHNCQIIHSFNKLWPALNPGGLYFVEDLHVNKYHKYISSTCNNMIFSELVKDWTEQLIYATFPSSAAKKYKLPEDLSFIFCIEEACVFGKKGQIPDYNGEEKSCCKVYYS